MAASRFECQLIGQQDIEKAIELQFGGGENIPSTAWGAMAASVVVSNSMSGPAQHRLVICYRGAEMLTRELPAVFRLHVVAPERIRLANLMAERQIGRAEAKAVLGRLAAEESAVRKRRFGEKHATATAFDLVVNEEAMGLAEMLDILAAAIEARGLMESDSISAEAAAKVQFQLRMRLARYGCAAADRAGGERSSGIRAKKFSLICSISIESPGITSRGAFRCSGTRTARSRKPSLPISICRSSIFTWS